MNFGVFSGGAELHQLVAVARRQRGERHGVGGDDSGGGAEAAWEPAQNFSLPPVVAHAVAVVY